MFRPHFSPAPPTTNRYEPSSKRYFLLCESCISDASPPPSVLHLRRKRPSRLLWALWLGFNGVGLAVVLALARYPLSLYVRNALFSELFDVQQLRSEEQLNAMIARRLR